MTARSVPEQLASWIGKTESTDDLIDARRVAQAAGTLGIAPAPTTGQPLPLPWHWLFFTPIAHADRTGPDGHPARGGFLPPVPLPRRMWAGSDVTCHQPLRVGAPVRRTSTIASVDAKSGRSGELVFVTVEHRFTGEDGSELMEERQHIVYREADSGTAAKTGRAADGELPDMQAQWESTLITDPVLLFRYSALTFNAHRIHYDRDYARQEEGYPGLVVQGPLLATLLLKLAYEALGGFQAHSFAFRARQPIFEGSRVTLCGARHRDTLTLWALTPERRLAMRLDASIGTPA